MKYALSDFTLTVEQIMRDPTRRSVTVFCNTRDPKTNRIRVTRCFKESFVVTYGRPNSHERLFLKLCKKAKTHPRKIWFEFKKPKKFR